MPITRPLRAVVAATAIGLGSLVLTAQPALAADITSAESMRAGDTGTIVASGFLPGDFVEVHFAGEVIGSGVADDDGVAVVEVTIPDDVPPGGHPVEVTSAETGEMAEGELVVEEPAGPASQPPAEETPATTQPADQTPPTTATPMAPPTTGPSTATPSTTPETSTPETSTPEGGTPTTVGEPTTTTEPTGDPEVAAPTPVTPGEPTGGSSSPLPYLGGGALLVLLGALALGTRERPPLAPPEEFPPTVYGEEIADQLLTDTLHLTHFTMQLKSTSRKRSPLAGKQWKDEFVLKRDDRADLFLLVQTLDQAGRHVSLDTIMVTGEQDVEWKHDCSVGGPPFMYDPDNPPPPAKLAQWRKEADTTTFDFSFGRLKRRATKDLQANVQNPHQYKLVAAWVLLTPNRTDANDSAFWTSVTTAAGAAGTLVLREVAKATGTAVVGPLGGTAASIATAAAIKFITGMWAGENTPPKPLVVKVDKRSFGGRVTDDIPVTNAKHSAEGAKIGTLPELWAHDVQSHTLDAPESNAHARARNNFRQANGVPEKVTVSFDTRLRVLVRRSTAANAAPPGGGTGGGGGM